MQKTQSHFNPLQELYQHIIHPGGPGVRVDSAAFENYRVLPLL